MNPTQQDLPFIPYHNHDSDITPYLGSEQRGEEKYDYYYSPQMGMPTVIARFGTDGEYYSGLYYVKQQLDMSQDIVPQLKVLAQTANDDYGPLATAALLSIEQGFLDTQLKAVEKNIEFPTHKKNKP